MCTATPAQLCASANFLLSKFRAIRRFYRCWKKKSKMEGSFSNLKASQSMNYQLDGGGGGRDGWWDYGGGGSDVVVVVVMVVVV